MLADLQAEEEAMASRQMERRRQILQEREKTAEMQHARNLQEELEKQTALNP